MKSLLTLTFCLLAATLSAQNPPAKKAVDPQRQPGPYKLGPDSEVKPGVPQGKVTKHTWEKSMVFPGTTRDYWVYVPAQYDAAKPAGLLVFQDGAGAVSPTGALRVPVVLDNLIAAGDLPPMIGLFVNPGRASDQKPTDKPKNRSLEYDTVSDAYGKFLHEELLPEVGQHYRISPDPRLRGIAGGSSGGICAFSVAWHRPESFGRVFSWVGSFTNIRGGHVCPDLIRDSARKPIRIYLQEGKNDLINQFGSWYEANQKMEAALKEKDYDFKMTYGEGGHNPAHAGHLLPEVLRWLFRDVKPTK
jgi:enterochelin esterase-like enzyme